MTVTVSMILESIFVPLFACLVFGFQCAGVVVDHLGGALIGVLGDLAHGPDKGQRHHNGQQEQDKCFDHAVCTVISVSLESGSAVE